MSTEREEIQDKIDEELTRLDKLVVDIMSVPLYDNEIRLRLLGAIMEQRGTILAADVDEYLRMKEHEAMYENGNAGMIRGLNCAVNPLAGMQAIGRILG